MEEVVSVGSSWFCGRKRKGSLVQLFQIMVQIRITSINVNNEATTSAEYILGIVING